MSRAATVAQVLEVARAELGTAEQPLGSNRVKYNTAYYGHVVEGENFAWCVVFLWWCCQKAGVPTSVFPKANNVFAVRDWFKQRDRFFDAPMPGDLVIFTRTNGHIGLVEKLLTDNRIQTIEGNAGDRVARFTYPSRQADTQGYCRPLYDPSQPNIHPLGGMRYTVRNGDTLSGIATRFRTTVGAIMAANVGVISDPDQIRVGQVITVPAVGPAGPVHYTVRPGDILGRIAQKFGTTVQRLMQLNPRIVDPDDIQAGMLLRVK